MYRIIALLCVLLFTGCTSALPPRPSNDNNYEADFRYPQLTANFALQEKVIYPDPRQGVMLHYIDRRMYGDLINVFVYPVPDILWDNRHETLNEQMAMVLGEIEQAVKLGMYQFKTEAVLSDFTFVHEGSEYAGKKARMQVGFGPEKILDSDIFLFLAEDKIIKFRTSFDASFTPDWTGDAIVRELLPEITPPPESEFMRNLRAQYLQQAAEQIMRALRDAGIEKK